MTIQQIPSKSRISVIKLQNFTIQRRQSLLKIIYGGLGFMISVILFAIDPVALVTSWVFDMREGSFIFNVWKAPGNRFDIKCEVWVLNYTNINEFLSGQEQVLRVDEVGPFMFREHRINHNMTVDREKGVLRYKPEIYLEFLPELSVAHYKDVYINAPCLPVLAISTLLADKLDYFTNLGAYYTIKAMNPKLFKNMTVEDYLWGYKDPIVSIANTVLPGWIDFDSIGILDRLFAKRDDTVELEMRNASSKFAIKTWNGLGGLKEQGFTDLETSIPCNRLDGAFEGLTFPANVDKNAVFPIFRRQACRNYPFSFTEELKSDYGCNMYRFTMDVSAFNNTSEYACKCDKTCLPNGIIDISKCYYGFAITLSKPHYTDVDPEQTKYFKGLKPGEERYLSKIDIEPTMGIPLSLVSTIQVNIAIRTSPANPITKPLNKRILPMVWFRMFVKEPPLDVKILLNLKFIYAPPLLLLFEIFVLVVGIALVSQGLYRIWRPRYQLVENKTEPKRRPSKTIKNVNNQRRTGNVVVNMSFNKGFADHEELAKQAVSLLTVHEDYDTIDRDT